MTGEDIFGIIIVSLLVGSLLADLFLDVTWNKTHFTYGLTIFVMRVSVSHWHTNIPSQALLEKKFHSDVVSSLVFRQIDACSYGFREKMLQFRWIRTPNLMHGLLTFDANNSQVVVKGLANLSTIVFSFLWLGLPLFGIVTILFSQQALESALILLGVIAFFGVIMGIMYFFQAARFSTVASFAAQSWTRKYVKSGDEA
jgi:hypothetical protein